MYSNVIKADYQNKTHAKDIVSLMNVYAQDKMGGGEALSLYVQENLTVELAKRSYAFSVLAYVDGEAVGLANCFEAFSTFACKPLVNIHDVIVLESHRGQGLNKQMLQKVEDIAREKDCCKLTLEVLDGNASAKRSYTKFYWYFLWF